MKKNHYFYDVYKREDEIKQLFVTIFLVLSSVPRFMIEVFIRKNFGHRYFIYSSAVLIGGTGILASVIAISAVSLISGDIDSSSFIKYGATWVIYFIAFLYFARKHRKDIKARDFSFYENRLSKYDGDLHPYFLERFGSPMEPEKLRRIQVLYEPLPFFIGGILLALLLQPIGFLLIFCSIVYSLGYMGAHYLGDEFFWDKNDEMIINKSMRIAFVKNEDLSKSHGIRIYGSRPKSEEQREELMSYIIEDGEPPIVS